MFIDLSIPSRVIRTHVVRGITWVHPYTMMRNDVPWQHVSEPPESSNSTTPYHTGHKDPLGDKTLSGVLQNSNSELRTFCNIPHSWVPRQLGAPFSANLWQHVESEALEYDQNVSKCIKMSPPKMPKQKFAPKWKNAYTQNGALASWLAWSATPGCTCAYLFILLCSRQTLTKWIWFHFTVPNVDLHNH